MAKEIVYAIGTGTISTAPKVANPLDGVWTPSLVSLKGTLKIVQEDGEVSEVYIDQSDAPIVLTHTTGKVTVEFSAPNTAKAQWEKYYNTVAVAAPVTSTEIATKLGALDATGVKIGYKEVTDMLMVEMKVGGQIFIFPNVDWSTSFAKDDDENPTLFKVVVTIKANESATGADFIVLNPKDSV